MDSIDVNTNGSFGHLLEENRRLRKLVNVLTEFKQFCDSIVAQLDHNLSSHHSRRYRQLTEKFNQCKDTEELSVEDGSDGAEAEPMDDQSRTSLMNLFRSALKRSAEEHCEPESSGRSRQEVSIIPILTPKRPDGEVTDIEVIELQDEDQDFDRRSPPLDPLDDQSIGLQREHRCEHYGCGRVFKNVYHLKRHQLTHSDSRPFPCPVRSCERRYKRNDHLATHMKQKHMKEYLELRGTGHLSHPIVCSKCNLRFRFNRSLAAHVCPVSPGRASAPESAPESTYIVASDENLELFDFENPCDVCPEVFDTRTALIEHKKRVHRIIEIDSQPMTTDGTDDTPLTPLTPSGGWVSHQSIGVSSSRRSSRGCGPYWLFAKEMRPLVLRQMKAKMAELGQVPTMSQVNKELGKQWHLLTEENKAIYYEKCHNRDAAQQPTQEVTP